MLLNKEIQMQRPNTLHNKIQQPVEEKIKLHKDPTHCIIRSNHIFTFLIAPQSCTPQYHDGGSLKNPIQIVVKKYS